MLSNLPVSTSCFVNAILVLQQFCAIGNYRSI